MMVHLCYGQGMAPQRKALLLLLLLYTSTLTLVSLTVSYVINVDGFPNAYYFSHTHMSTN